MLQQDLPVVTELHCVSVPTSVMQPIDNLTGALLFAGSTSTLCGKRFATTWSRPHLTQMTAWRS